MTSDGISSFNSLNPNDISKYSAASEVLSIPISNFKTLIAEDTASGLMKDITLQDQPNTDIFQSDRNKDLIKNPSWKKWLSLGVALGTGALLAINIAKGKLNFKNIKLPKININNFMQKIKNIGSSFINYIKTPFIWVAKKFSHKP